MVDLLTAKAIRRGISLPWVSLHTDISAFPKKDAILTDQIVLRFQGRRAQNWPGREKPHKEERALARRNKAQMRQEEGTYHNLQLLQVVGGLTRMGVNSFSHFHPPMRALHLPFLVRTPKMTAQQPDHFLHPTTKKFDWQQTETQAIAQIKSGTDPNTAMALGEWYPLHWAIAKGYTHLITVLLEKGADTLLTARPPGSAQSIPEETPLRLCLRLSATTPSGDTNWLSIKNRLIPTTKNHILEAFVQEDLDETTLIQALQDLKDSIHAEEWLKFIEPIHPFEKSLHDIAVENHMPEVADWLANHTTATDKTPLTDGRQLSFAFHYPST